jgi:MYXO-CTERM domain-containing protein
MPDHVADCRDPMSFSYHGPCGGTPRGFFRDHLMGCANVGSTVCTCGGNKVNDHQHLVGVLGANPDFDDDTPVVTINNAADGDPLTATTAFSVAATAHRGVYRMELYLNGWLWGSWDAPDAPSFGDPWPVPAALLDPDDGYPDGNYDVEVRAYDDLGTPGSAHVMMTKGAACTDASQCLEGQQCTGGGCVWDQPSGQLGDPCTFDQACVGPNIYDGLCFDDGGGDAFCSRPCFGGPNDDCGDGWACAVTDTADNSGVCEPATVAKPGCCSTGGAPPTGALALGAVIGALVLRRRRPTA